MMRENAFQRPLVFHTLALAAILSVLGGIAAQTMQQMLRRGANQPQLDMADSYTRGITQVGDASKVIPPEHVDLEQSLQPVVVFYDDAGTGYLDRKLPVPPPGVFDFVRVNGAETVTWQPRPDVRLASVIRRIGGNHPGFLLTARSLGLLKSRRAFSGAWFLASGL